MADPNQTPSRPEWACPCSGCAKAVAFERKQLIKIFEQYKQKYLIDRGSSFDKDGNLLWAKDDAEGYAEGIDQAIFIINERIASKKEKK